MSRRLPIYVLIDTSGSMRGEAIQSVNVGLQALVSALRQNPHAMDTVHLSVITFDMEVKELFPLTPIEDVQLSDISVPSSGATYLGEALALLADRAKRDVARSTADQRGDWSPIAFIMTDGSPSDTARFNEMAAKFQTLNFGNVIACAAGPKAKEEYLKRITNTVVRLDTTDSAAFETLFEWLSKAADQASRGIGQTKGDALPPPPDEIIIV